MSDDRKLRIHLACRLSDEAAAAGALLDNMAIASGFLDRPALAQEAKALAAKAHALALRIYRENMADPEIYEERRREALEFIEREGLSSKAILARFAQQYAIEFGRIPSPEETLEMLHSSVLSPRQFGDGK